ncbi:hypothetical protein [Winogradskyella sp. A2]|uniref:hypothetical protein n=1 Tax=Winogradskyella sp. A2 TaxID=3366944 RepID=UPI00398C7694
MKLFTGDPLSTFDANPLTGVISNLGILLWCTTGSILLFTFFLVIGKVENKKTSFLLYSGLLTLVLLFDDLFMFHEHILKSIGIEEIVMYGIYVILFGILFLAYYRILLSAQFRYFLIITFISFGSSVIIDLLFEHEKFRILFEDGFKFLGIVCWFMFFTFYCLDITKNINLKNQ